MQEVRVGRERRFAALVLGDRDLMLLGEGDERGARCEAPLPPRRDHPDVRLERVGREFEAHLVVALAGRAMGDCVGADLARDFDQTLGDEGSRDRRAEQDLALVLGVGAEHREHVVAYEFLAQVLDEDVFGLDPKHLRLLARGFELLALSEVGGEGDDFGAVGRLQPLEDDGSVEAAGIGEDDALDLGLGAGHRLERPGLGGVRPDLWWRGRPAQPPRARITSGRAPGRSRTLRRAGATIAHQRSARTVLSPALREG